MNGDGGWTLMAAAGRAAWQVLLQHWPHARRLCVVVGSGNNGGDGLVLAMHALQAGRRVHVIHGADARPASALARRALQAFEQAGGRTAVFSGALPHVDVVVDALLGIGLSGPPRSTAAALIAAINAQAAPVFSLDVPSGMDAQQGCAPAEAVSAHVTLQFIVPHQGLYTGDGREHSGHRQVAPLDLPAAAWQGVQASATAWGADRVDTLLPPRALNAHKGSSGHVLCMGGNVGSGGAVLLTAEAALRSGAGLASIATRGAHVGAALARLPEAMTRDADEEAALATLIPRATVIAVGPGLGQDDWARHLWQRARDSGQPLVVDADALNLLANSPRAIPDAVLTPHPGEAGRLLGCATSAIQADRFGAVQALADRYQATVVLKGAGTLVAAPAQRPVLVNAGNPGMAVGGMGDLLTGIIAALRAQGLGAFEAAAGGALLHAAAGDRAAADGARGLLPTDLLPHLRRLSNPG